MGKEAKETKKLRKASSDSESVVQLAIELQDKYADIIDENEERSVQQSESKLQDFLVSDDEKKKKKIKKTQNIEKKSKSKKKKSDTKITNSMDLQIAKDYISASAYTVLSKNLQLSPQIFAEKVKNAQQNFRKQKELAAKLQRDKKKNEIIVQSEPQEFKICQHCANNKKIMSDKKGYKKNDDPVKLCTMCIGALEKGWMKWESIVQKFTETNRITQAQSEMLKKYVKNLGELGLLVDMSRAVYVSKTWENYLKPTKTMHQIIVPKGFSFEVVDTVNSSQFSSDGRITVNIDSTGKWNGSCFSGKMYGYDYTKRAAEFSREKALSEPRFLYEYLVNVIICTSLAMSQRWRMKRGFSGFEEIMKDSCFISVQGKNMGTSSFEYSLDFLQ